MRRFGAALVTLGILAACDSIVARPLTSAPVNACPQHPCGGYDADAGPTAATCRPEGQCEITAAGNRPASDFYIVVNLPSTSVFAPGLTYVFFGNAAAGVPVFAAPVVPNPRCNPTGPKRCLQLGGAASFAGSYTAKGAATATIASTLDAVTLAPIASLIGDPANPLDHAIPVRVMFTPYGNTQRDQFPVLPVDPLVVTSGTNYGASAGATNDYGRVLLAGTYVRELYPEFPFDAIYPPTTQQITFESAVGETTTVRNDLLLVAPPTTGQPLDFTTNQCSVTGTQQDSRCAVVTRDDGLDGWRVWIEDPTTKKRISVLRTFSNTLVDGNVTVVTHAAALLYTAIGKPLGDDFSAVVAPPESFIGVPRLETRLFGGQGLQTLVVPTFPPPVTVRGVVAEPGDASALLGYPAKVTLVSTSLTTRTVASPLLHYEATVSTDDRGRFATVLPPGTYIATIEPAIGTGFAKAITTVLVDRTVTALTLQPPARPLLHGRATLTDGRALSEATVIAEPRTAPDGTGSVGRPGRATTIADGSYAIELDPGPYVLSVLPKVGTGFPNIVTSITVDAGTTTVPDLHIPPPERLSLTLRDPNSTANVIVRAVVRIYAPLPGISDPVEIGNGMTDADGLVEILLAPQAQ